MGADISKSNSEPVIREVLQNHTEADSQLENKTKELHLEVKSFKQQFPEKYVKKTLTFKEDAFVLRYKDLKDTTKILESLREMLGKLLDLDFILDTAKAFVLSMHSTDELEKIHRWQSHRAQNINGEVIGIEVHYKLKIFKMKSKMSISSQHEDIVIMVGYRFMVHVMNNMYYLSWNKLNNMKL